MTKIDAKSIDLVTNYFAAKEKVKEITKQSKANRRKERIAELMAQGIDKLTAEVMADCGV